MPELCPARHTAFVGWIASRYTWKLSGRRVAVRLEPSAYCLYAVSVLRKKSTMTINPSHHTANWKLTCMAGAVLALTACGGGGNGEDPVAPPPTTPPTTQELVQTWVQATEAITAKQLPTSGAERFALLDACYLGNASTKQDLASGWNANTQASNAYLVGRTISNVQIVAERKTTNADGSARHEVDISSDEKYTDGTTLMGSLETLVSGSTSGTCATAQTGTEMRALGNQRIVSARLFSRNISYVFNKLADGELTGTRVRREVRFQINDPGKKATYAVASWSAADGSARSLKLLSPRIARDAPEMQGKRGNAAYADGDAFRICGSEAAFSSMNAATADCTQVGVVAENWGWHVNAPYTAEKLAAGDQGFEGFAPTPGAQVTYQIYADDGWRTVNGQQGKTPIATYRSTLRNAPYTLAAMAAAPAAYPEYTSSSLTNAELVAAVKGTGGSTTLAWTPAMPPTGGLPLVATDIYAYRQGPNEANANGFPTVRSVESVALGQTATSATLPIGGVPAGAKNTNYAESGLTYSDRNGRTVFFNVQFSN